MEQLLRDGLTTLGLPTGGIPALIRYADLLVEKNKVMNLTAITEPADIAALHFLDSAALLTLADWKGKTVADIGTGAGFPGLPLRIVDPSIRLTLLDAQNKRVEFLKEVCGELGLADVECVHARAEEFAADHREGFDLVTSRAVAALPLLCELCLPFVRTGGVFLAMKGPDCAEELDEARNAISKLGGTYERTVRYTIPGTDVTHSVVVIRKTEPTPPKYPRRWAKMQKEHL